MNKMNIGHIVKNSDLHVTGYDKKAGKIIIQLSIGEDAKVKTLKLYKNAKGEYFKLNNKTMYLSCESGLFESEQVITNKTDNKRVETIQRYENIKLKWDNDEDLKRILPEVYEDICRKLKGLKVGAEYKITDKTSELKNMIAYVGGQIPRINYKGKNHELINVNSGITYDKAKEIAEVF